MHPSQALQFSLRNLHQPVPCKYSHGPNLLCGLITNLTMIVALYAIARGFTNNMMIIMYPFGIKLIMADLSLILMYSNCHYK